MRRALTTLATLLLALPCAPAVASAQDPLLQASPTRGQVRLAARDAAAAAGIACRVTDAVLLGPDGDGGFLYEAVCADGPGYVIQASERPRAWDCVALAGMVERGAGGRTCRMPANRNVLTTIRALAVEAGVRCRVDRGMRLGDAPDGAALYEIGCDGRDGWWIEQAATGWIATPCLVVTAQGGACRYTTPAESRASATAWLGGACRVTDVRYMGSGADGAWYEVKCGGGAHMAIRFDDRFSPMEGLPCNQASGIGGGCVLGD